MKKKLGCDSCDDGNVWVYFKNEGNQTIRNDFYHCIYCHEDAGGSVSPLLGEEEISVDEFTNLLDQGWNLSNV